MWRKLAISTITLTCCLAVTLAYGVERGRSSAGRPGGAERPAGGASPGGRWSQRTHQGGQFQAQHQYPHSAQRPAGATTGAEGAFSNSQRRTPTTGAQDAAAGAAVQSRRSPQATPGESAAAGAAVANRRQPQVSGAEGAAA